MNSQDLVIYSLLKENAGFEKIDEVPIVESTEGANLIANVNGEAKQIPASTVMTQPDWNETDETSPAFIMNKPDESRKPVCYECSTGESILYYLNERENGKAVTSKKEWDDAFQKGTITIRLLNHKNCISKPISYMYSVGDSSVLKCLVGDSTSTTAGLAWLEFYGFVDDYDE